MSCPSKMAVATNLLWAVNASGSLCNPPRKGWEMGGGGAGNASTRMHRTFCTQISEAPLNVCGGNDSGIPDTTLLLKLLLRI